MIEVGEPVPNLATAIYDVNNQLADGGVVTAQITLPDGTTTAATVTHVSQGLYTAAYTAVQSGQHVITWTVTGANAGVHTDGFSVEQTAYSIVSLAEVKAHLRINRTAEDEVLRLLSAIASDLAESPEGTGRVWRRRTITNELHDGGGYFIQLNRYPVLSVTSVSVDGVALSVNLAPGSTSDIDLSPSSGVIYATSGYFGYNTRRRGVAVTYVVGATAVPPAVRDGVLELVRHLYGLHRGGANLPRQEEPDYTTSLAYLVPNRVAMAFRAHAGGNIG